MRIRRKNMDLFQEGHVWKEKISDAYVMLGRPNGEIIPCFLVYVKKNNIETSYEKANFWCNAHKTALFKHFIKII